MAEHSTRHVIRRDPRSSTRGHRMSTTSFSGCEKPSEDRRRHPSQTCCSRRRGERLGLWRILHLRDPSWWAEKRPSEPGASSSRAWLQPRFVLRFGQFLRRLKEGRYRLWTESNESASRLAVRAGKCGAVRTWGQPVSWVTVRTSRLVSCTQPCHPRGSCPPAKRQWRSHSTRAY